MTMVQTLICLTFEVFSSSRHLKTVARKSKRATNHILLSFAAEYCLEGQDDWLGTNGKHLLQRYCALTHTHTHTQIYFLESLWLFQSLFQEQNIEAKAQLLYLCNQGNSGILSQWWSRCCFLLLLLRKHWHLAAAVWVGEILVKNSGTNYWDNSSGRNIIGSCRSFPQSIASGLLVNKVIL